MANKAELNKIVRFSQAIEKAIKNSGPTNPLTPERVTKIQKKLGITYAPVIIEAMVNATYQSLCGEENSETPLNFVIPREKDDIDRHAESAALTQHLTIANPSDWETIISLFPLEGDYHLSVTD